MTGNMGMDFTVFVLLPGCQDVVLALLNSFLTVTGQFLGYDRNSSSRLWFT